VCRQFMEIADNGLVSDKRVDHELGMPNLAFLLACMTRRRLSIVSGVGAIVRIRER